MKKYQMLKGGEMEEYPIILDACRDCPDRDKCHRTFEELVRCKRTDEKETKDATNPELKMSVLDIA